MSRKKTMLFTILLIVTLLSGCSNYNEPERMLYIYGIGIDYEDNLYHVYAKVINFASVAKSEQPSVDEKQSQVGHASGKTVNDAIFNLYHTLDERLFWGHLTYIIFTEEALKNERLNTVIEMVTRYRETRYQIWLYSTEDSVKDILLTVPIINKSTVLSKLGDPMNSFSQESFIEPVNIRTTIIGLNEPGYEVVLPTVSVINTWESIDGKDSTAELIGFGVVSRDTFKGFITGEKANGLKWMNNKSKRTAISMDIDTGDDENSVTVVCEKINVHVEPIVEGDSVSFDIEVKMNVTLSSIHGKVTTEQIQKQLKEEIKQEIMVTYEEALKKDSDIYRLSEYLYRKNVKVWKRVEHGGKVDLSDNSINKLDITIKEIKSGNKSFTEPIK